MAVTKQDKRSALIAISIICLGAITAVLAYAKWGLAGGAIAFGLTLGSVLCLVGWLVCFYRCPTCRRELLTDEPDSLSTFCIRHHCPKCDVTWESGIEINSGQDM